ncbi:hypothetical protein BC831DRAFT_32661 [Entophlyctis helioformis]|nr:hypothetical protein BC831DRAFT_32661 [Entophlyctis helioformis]
MATQALVPMHRLLAMLCVAACLPLASAMDWVIYTSLRRCSGTSGLATGAYSPFDNIHPVTAVNETRICVPGPYEGWSYYSYKDASKSQVNWNQCTSSDCALAGCRVSAFADVWVNTTTLTCGTVAVPLSSSNPALTIDEFERGLTASGMLGKLGQGPEATAYQLQLFYPAGANCGGNPVGGGVLYIFESCTRSSATEFNINLFPTDQLATSYTTQTCEGSQCQFGCRVTKTDSLPVPKGSPPTCVVDSLFSALRFEGKPFVATSRFANGQFDGGSRGSGTQSASPPNPTSTSDADRPVQPGGTLAGLSTGGILGVAFAFMVVGVGFGIALFVVIRRRSAMPNPSSPDDTQPDKPPPAYSPPNGRGDLTVVAVEDASARASAGASARTRTFASIFKTNGRLATGRLNASDAENQMFGVMEVPAPSAVRDLDAENQMYGVMEVPVQSSIRRT